MISAIGTRSLRAGQVARLDSAHAHAPHRLARDARPRRRRVRQQRRLAVALIGASGSGKSTLLRCIDLLEDIDDGACCSTAP